MIFNDDGEVDYVMISKLIDAATKISFFFGGRARHVQQNSEENSKEFSSIAVSSCQVHRLILVPP